MRLSQSERIVQTLRGGVLRIDRETRRDIALDTCERLKTFIEMEMPRVDGVLVSDYDKGLITKALMERITAAARAHGKFVIVDPKAADFSRYRGATLLTPNRKEAARAAGSRSSRSTMEGSM